MREPLCIWLKNVIYVSLYRCNSAQVGEKPLKRYLSNLIFKGGSSSPRAKPKYEGSKIVGVIEMLADDIEKSRWQAKRVTAKQTVLFDRVHTSWRLHVATPTAPVP